MGVARDVVIAGGGIIGLSLAIELAGEGLAVTVLERDVCMRGASWAAAGMLAAEDPHNPAALLPLARLSRELYPEYLARIERLSQVRIPLRTSVALQQSEQTVDALAIEVLAPGITSRNFTLQDEASVDPRDLCAALPVAARSMGVELLENCSAFGTRATAEGVAVQTTEGEIAARFFVDCRGMESAADMEPCKGQLLMVAFPSERLRCAVRTDSVYIVPRGDGKAVIGATMERGTSDTTVDEDALDELQSRAEAILPGIAQAPRLDSWAGVRPGTPDDLPILGPTGEPNCFIATGHFKNGILLAPGTAHVLSQLLRGETPSVDIDAFTISRFVPARH